MSGSLDLAPTDAVLALITKSFTTIPTTANPSASQSTLRLSDDSTVTGTNTIATHLSSTIFPADKYEYSALELALIDQWLSLTGHGSLNDEVVGQLNVHLKDKTSILGTKPSIADIVAYVRLKDLAKGWSKEERTGGVDGGKRYILRWLDWVQNSPVVGLKLEESEKLEVDAGDVGTVVRGEEPVDEKKAAKKAKGKDKEATGDAAGKGVVEKAKGAVQAAAEKIGVVGKDEGSTSAAGAKKEKQKKEKQQRQPAKKEEPAGPSPINIDLRVGFIEKCVPHPDADSLYVSTIHCGDAEPRTVCSGLRNHIPIEEMQERYVVVVANLKPVKMRGIMSQAMVLAASPTLKEGEVDDHKGPIELVAPPAGAKAGEKVFFEGYDGTPEAVLNPKKKIWEAVQPGFTTTEGLEVGFDVAATAGAVAPAGGEGVKKLVAASGGVCTVKTLVGATVR
ncbi:G4 quadruplex nucleic acid binding protein [Arthrobotrys musiformis]|uniref:G4 quadruplex nucleic acid binding protein n=1 Tax=Arthrobotrys musiformis TaxID=47236 RepID=A0AAV9W148_9PEZI